MRRWAGPMTAILAAALVCFFGIRFHLRWIPVWRTGDHAAETEDLSTMKETLRMLIPAAGRIAVRAADAVLMTGTGSRVLDAGAVGRGAERSGTAFPDTLYPFRAMLSEEAAAVYDQVYDNAMQLNGESFLLEHPLGEEELSGVMNAVCNDHPELFWLDSVYTFGYRAEGEKAVTLRISFNPYAEDIGNSMAAFSEAAEEILSGLPEGLPAAEAEREIHDRLLLRTEYDRSAPGNQTAYSALVEGRSVCAGYARALQYLLMRAGIPCFYCEGTAGGGDHAWNVVFLNGVYRNVDPSWDDGDPPGREWFNLTDSQIAATHVRGEMSMGLPACTG